MVKNFKNTVSEHKNITTNHILKKKKLLMHSTLKKPFGNIKTSQQIIFKNETEPLK